MSVNVPPNSGGSPSAIKGIVSVRDVEPFEHKARTQWLELRDIYARWILVGMGVEVLVSMFALVGIGLGLLRMSPWVADVFFVGVFGEIVGLATIVVKHLFPLAEA